MIQSLAQRGISKDHNVKVRPQPRCKTEDIEDHFKPILRKNPDAITIHSGTNDAKNDKTTKKKKKGNKAKPINESINSSHNIRIDTPRGS